MQSPLISREEIHPVSLNLTKKGHPWITEDSFTKRFKKNSLFLEAYSKGKFAGYFLNDPKHPQIKARYFSDKKIDSLNSFKKEIYRRLLEAFLKRKNEPYFSARENVYLLFGEADFLPGIFIQKIKDQFLIQFYSYVWVDHQELFINLFEKAMETVFKTVVGKSSIWVQMRSPGAKDQEPPKCLDQEIKDKTITFKEFEVQYQAYLGQSYDIGIYTDMSSVRESLTPFLKESKKVLNLFSYTGAFSLYSLSLGAEEVVSVDLSNNYLSLLEENLKLNNFTKHQSMQMSVLKALTKLEEEKRIFDFIICDPPSSSSDGSKTSKALKDYESLLNKMFALTTKGSHILLFLNTHKITKDKFKEAIKPHLNNNKKASIIREFGLRQDCPTLKGFPEGSYLKGLLLKVN